MKATEGLEHFEGQYHMEKGSINLQFNYSRDTKEIVWVHIYPSLTAGLPANGLRLAKDNGKWRFLYEYRLADDSKRTDVFDNEEVQFLIEKMFELLKQRGFTDNVYFE